MLGQLYWEKEPLQYLCLWSDDWWPTICEHLRGSLLLFLMETFQKVITGLWKTMDQNILVMWPRMFMLIKGGQIGGQHLQAIECVWRELKHFISRIIKPINTKGLADWICLFGVEYDNWEMLCLHWPHLQVLAKDSPGNDLISQGDIPLTRTCPYANCIWLMHPAHTSA